MGDPPDRVEIRLRRLELALEDIEERLRAIEEDDPRELRVGTEAAAAMPATSREAPDVAPVLSLAGRTLVVLAGAYLLRALTESGWLGAPAGVTLGLVYAALWLVAADRAGAAGKRLSAELHGGAAMVIAVPLVWEAATTRQLLAGHSIAGVLSAIVLFALIVAWRRGLHALAWVTTAGSVVLGTALLVKTGDVAGFAAFFIALGIGTLWLGYDRGWYGLRWPAGLVADIAVLDLTARALAEPASAPPAAAIGAQLLLVGAYLTTIAARTLVRGRTVIPFEVAQAAAALAVGLGGATLVTSATGVGSFVVGIGSLLMGVGCYAVAFAFVARRQGRGVNFYFYTSIALALTLVGSHGILTAPVLALTWGGLAMLLAWLSRRLARPSLSAHGAVYATAAALESGLLATSMAALLSSAPAWPAWTPAAYGVLAMLGLAMSARPPSGTEWGAAARVPRCALALLVTVGASGLATSLLVTWIAGSPAVAGESLPTIRTGVVAGAAIVLALASRSDRWAELGWLVYPALAAGATKLVLDDIRHSPAAMLVIALTAYGAALIAAPRLSGTRHTVHSHEPQRSESTV